MYQMLPSALVDLGDDHKKLFETSSWGTLPVSKALLAKGDTLLRSLDTVTDAERLLYIAGANLETPARIQIGSPGQFSYRESLDGDGRVPHELGLLEGVTTYWVDRGVHGDLVKHTIGAGRDHRAAPDRQDRGPADREAGQAAGSPRSRVAG